MDLLVIVLTLIPTLMAALEFTNENVDPRSLNNSNDTNKDLYVIHAMVYQVGIVTNKTNDDDISGNQEAVTFYQTNGSSIDLTNIPTPLVTNVTAQRIVGVAPLPSTAEDINMSNDKSQLPWKNFDHLEFLHQPNSEQTRARRNSYSYVDDDQDESDDSNSKNVNVSKTDTNFGKYKRSLNNEIKLKAKNSSLEIMPVRIVQGTSIIPEEASMQSLVVPPLLTLNSNFSEIPVPIPNTSVVHYAKINTLIQKP